MKKFTWLLVGLIVVGIVLGSISVVYAGNANRNANLTGNMKKLFEKIYSKFYVNGVVKGLKLGIFSEKVAGFLGVKVPDLIKARKNGESLAAIAIKNGKSEADLINFIYNICKPRIDSLLSKGKITKDQYNAITIKLIAAITKRVERVR
jgi:uncharacterized membrane protein